MNVDTQGMVERLARITERVASACRHCGRDPATVRLIAASKFQAVDAICSLAELGVTSFGENYADELVDKSRTLADRGISWAFIGALQSNKIQRIVECADEILTVTSEKHLRYISRYAQRPFPVYISVNPGRESTKSGVAPDRIDELVACGSGLVNIRLMGIMVLPPKEISLAATDEACRVYRDYKALAQKVGEGSLSLGMSADLEAAIIAGSDIVRVGTGLFGSRSKERSAQ